MSENQGYDPGDPEGTDLEDPNDESYAVSSENSPEYYASDSDSDSVDLDDDDDDNDEIADEDRDFDESPYSPASDEATDMSPDDGELDG